MRPTIHSYILGFDREVVMKSIRQLLFLYICIVFMAVMCLVGVIKQDEEFSIKENRYLTSRPKFSASGMIDGSYMKQFETYVNEQIPFRSQWILAKSLLQRVMLRQENNDIIAGKNGYLFEKKLSAGVQFNENMGYIIDFVREYHNKAESITVAAAPNSYGVLAQYLPKGIPNVNQETTLNAFLGGDLYRNCFVLDLQKTLSKHADEYIYYRTDHHWTTLGAYYAYTAYCEEKGFEPIEISNLLEKRIANFTGTYYAKADGFIREPDTITYFEIPIDHMYLPNESKVDLYDVSKASEFDKYATFLYGNYGMVQIDTADGEKDKESILIIKDSYANCLIPFLSYHYNTIYVVDLRYFAGSIGELIADKQPIDILTMNNFSNLTEDKHFYKLLQ